MTGWQRLRLVLIILYWLLALAIAVIGGGFLALIFAAILFVVIWGVVWVISGFLGGGRF